MLNGIINIYKEPGYTSHDVVAKLRGILHMKKIGHTGTLDPMACGVLPVCLGNATKVCDLITDWSKGYEAELELGMTTDTQDNTGTVIRKADPELLNSITEDSVKRVIESFVGEQDQIPPMYSAKKVGGRKLCDMARKGIEVERKPCRINILSIDILNMDLPRIKLSVRCSKGTYIRTLCNDMGDKLGCGAVMTSLVRTDVGDFKVKDAYTLAEIEALKDDHEKINAVVTRVDHVFTAYKPITVNEDQDKIVLNGGYLYDMCSDDDGLKYRIYTSDGSFKGIYMSENGVLKPLKMFL